jgi:hypothetical protein
MRHSEAELERAHSFLQVVQESLRLMLMLKADNGVIRIADGNQVAGRVSAPAMGPEIERSASRRSQELVKSPRLAACLVHCVLRAHLP